MPGILDQVAPAGINPGLLSAQNLVSANAPEPMSASAVQAMTDSMRTGAITAQDIVDRLGEHGKTKRKAEIERHKREIEDLRNPELVAAKHAVELAAANKARLESAQSLAATELVPQQAQLQAGALAQGLSELGTGIPSATLRQLNLVYNLGAKFDPQTGVLQNPDEVMPNLTHIMGAMNGMQMAKELATRVDTVDSKDAAGNVTKVPVWKGTGKPLNEAQKGIINRYNSILPGLIPGSVSGFGPASVQPVQQDNHARSAAALVSPIAPPSGPPVDEQGNLITSQMTEVEKQKHGMELSEESRKQEIYKDWRRASMFYDNAVDAISAINKVPLEAQRRGTVNLNAKDTELAEAVVKMLDPQGVVREFKWNKFESNQPWPEQIANVMSRIKQEGKFTPETRQELFQIANASVRSREQQAADFLKLSKSKGAPLTDREDALATGQFTPEYGRPGSTPAATTGATAPIMKSLQGRQMIRNAGGKTFDGEIITTFGCV
jgi:hypothetical protein